MSETHHIRGTRTMSWLLAAAATCVLVIGMWPGTLLASCMSEQEPSCCCSSQTTSQSDAANAHDCAESGCQCHVAPDNQPPAPLDAVVDAAPGASLAPPRPAPAFTWPHTGERSPEATPARGDPLAPSAAIYLEHQVLLL